MKQKVQRISNILADKLSKWGQVDTITIQESAEEDLFSPYFFISLDVFYKGEVPGIEERKKLFEDAGGFESSSHSKKDRFFIEEVPVRLEFKSLDRINHILGMKQDGLVSFRDSGTYMFYRILKGKVLVQKSMWLDQVKKKLLDLPSDFWDMLIVSSLSEMEHYLIDLKASVMEADSYFYTTSVSGFLKSLSSLLFAVNREFEPSSRRLHIKMKSLKVLPEHFNTRLETIISPDSDMDSEQKAEIAELLAKSMLSLTGPIISI